MKDVQVIPILLLLAIGSLSFSLGQDASDITGKINHLLFYVQKVLIFWNLINRLQRSISQTFWKPQFVTKSLLFESETSNFGYLLIFSFCQGLHFAELCKVSERLDNIKIRHFIRVSTLMFFDFLIHQNFKGGTLLKFIISMLSNLAENLHSSAKLKKSK